jgi:hypothetical protein
VDRRAGVLACSAAAAAGGSPNRLLLAYPKGSFPPSVERLNPPTPPDKAGCYELAAGTWRTIACKSRAYVRAHVPVPEPLPAIEYKRASRDTNPKGTRALPITNGLVQVHVTNDGSDTDSKAGPDAFSLQLNTNSFTGNNGNIDWVQFVDSSRPGTLDDLCIWNIDLTTHNYSPKCGGPTNTTAGFLRAGDVALISGGDAIPGPSHFLFMEAYLPWDSTTTVYLVVALDTYGLTRSVSGAPPWDEISGSILGYGNGSTANFVPGSRETTDLATVDCIYAACLPEPGPSGEHSTHKQVAFSSQLTEESSNLEPMYGTFGQNTALPTLRCSVVVGVHGCATQFTGTAS